jgi:hypothetical protein
MPTNAANHSRTLLANAFQEIDALLVLDVDGVDGVDGLDVEVDDGFGIGTAVVVVSFVVGTGLRMIGGAASQHASSWLVKVFATTDSLISGAGVVDALASGVGAVGSGVICCAIGVDTEG